MTTSRIKKEEIINTFQSTKISLDRTTSSSSSFNEETPSDIKSQEVQSEIYKTTPDFMRENHGLVNVATHSHIGSSSTSSSYDINQQDDSSTACADWTQPESNSSLQQQRQQYDPFRVITTEQLQGYEYLISTPIWIFDFKQCKNRWANQAGLRVWNSPSLEEFVRRNMKDMSDTTYKRTLQLQHQIEQGHVIQDLWTYYPKGQAKTVLITITGVRMSQDENHTSMLIIGSTESPSSIVFSPKSKSRRRNSTGGSGSSIVRNCCGILPSHPREQEGTDIIKTRTVKDSDLDEDEDDSKETFDETIHTNPLYQESLRVAEIIRHLPNAVCQFDMNGKLMYQNPAAYIPQSLEADEKLIDNMQEENIVCETNKDSDDYILHEGIPLSLAANSSIQGDFIHRFVDRNLAKEFLHNLQAQNDPVSSPSESSSPTNTTITIEAELYTSIKGQTQWSQIQLCKRKDPVTSQPVILYSAHDKTDAVEARREREARIEKTEFLAIMAHEIRTPLHQVTGFIDLLDSSTKLPKQSLKAESMDFSTICSTMTEEQKGYIKLLQSSSQQLMTVISDVLDYSKLEAGQMKMEYIPFEPYAVVKGSMAAIRDGCKEKGLSLIFEYGENGDNQNNSNEPVHPFATDNRNRKNIIPFRIMGDPNRVRQVLLNLLSNAVKFTSNGEIRVQVSAFVTDGEASIGPPSNVTKKCSNTRWIKFMIIDTGLGISKDYQKTIFEKYQQANASVARKYGGTGLGLSICKTLVDKMGGSIGVESELGRGSSFWFVLPIVTPMSLNDGPLEKKSHRRHNSLEYEQPVAPMTVLVAEDNKINQRLVCNMLRRMGHKSVVVENGQEAIELVEQYHHDAMKKETEHAYDPDCGLDVVLMDIQMPIMDGLEATRRLRTMGYTQLPILGLTASMKRSDYVDLGFDDWLPKPILMDDLKRKLYEQQQQKKRQQQQQMQNQQGEYDDILQDLKWVHPRNQMQL